MRLVLLQSAIQNRESKIVCRPFGDPNWVSAIRTGSRTRPSDWASNAWLGPVEDRRNNRRLDTFTCTFCVLQIWWPSPFCWSPFSHPGVLVAGERPAPASGRAAEQVPKGRERRVPREHAATRRAGCLNAQQMSGQRIKTMHARMALSCPADCLAWHTALN